MKKYLFIILFLLVACTKDDMSSILVINASIEENKTGSKAVTYGSSFSNGNTLGLFVYYAENVDPHTQFRPYGEKYNNIRALYNNGSWVYRFMNSTSDFDNIYLLNPTIETFTQGLTIYAYSPWIAGTESITRVPFALGGQSKSVVDLMRASQNNTSVNARIVPDGGAKSVNLTFNHVFAMLRFGFRCEHDVTEMKVTSITVRRSENAVTPLYVSGELNAIDGTFGSLVESDELTTVYSDDLITFDDTGYEYLPFLIMPGEYHADGDYEVVFRFDNQQLEYVYPITRDDISVENITLFKAGFTYTFLFTFDNHIRFDNVTVSDSWTEINENLVF